MWDWGKGSRVSVESECDYGWDVGIYRAWCKLLSRKRVHDGAIDWDCCCIRRTCILQIYDATICQSVLCDPDRVVLDVFRYLVCALEVFVNKTGCRVTAARFEND